MRAHCHDPRHGAVCRRQRQVTLGPRCSGRPVGALVSWLQDAANCDSHQEHVSKVTAGHQQRLEARQWFSQTVPGAGSLLAFEESQNGGPDEPDHVL